MTFAEGRVWELLKEWQKGTQRKFRPQVVTRGYIPDFVDEERKVIVEIDGSVHARLRESDAIRQKHLEDAGYQVLRFTNEEAIHNTEYVVDSILHL